MAPTPWEWHQNEKLFTPVSQKVWADKPNLLNHMKIMRFHPIADKAFKKLDWTEAGIKFWRDMAPVCLG